MSEWVTNDPYIDAAGTKNNAEIVNSFIVAHMPSWSLISRAAVLGCMEGESGINPGQWEVGMPKYGDMTGYGLVQWTPYTDLVGAAAGAGYSNWEDGTAQMWALKYEYDTGYNGQWFQVRPSSVGYGVTWPEWAAGTGFGLDDLVQIFIENYLRPATNDHPNYQANARKWYTWLTTGEVPDVPVPGPGPGPGPSPEPGGQIDVKNPLNLVWLLKGWGGLRHELSINRRR